MAKLIPIAMLCFIWRKTVEMFNVGDTNGMMFSATVVIVLYIISVILS